MSLSRHSAASNSFTLSLSLWYSLIFTVSAGILFWLSYVLLSGALERKDHEVIETRLKACAAIYEEGGLSALRDFVDRSRESEKSRAFFVRVANPTGSALLLNVPEDWVQFDAGALQAGGDPSQPSVAANTEGRGERRHGGIGAASRTQQRWKSGDGRTIGKRRCSPFAATFWR